MSALRRAVARRTHKERSQPAERQKKYGLLEKHKDYVLRAKDFHRKEQTIKNLKRKAEDRNPDEFYFAMQSKTTKNGVHIERDQESQKYTDDEIKMMKTQDLTYVQMRAQMDLKKAAKMRETLHMVGEPKNKKIKFVDDGDDPEEPGGADNDTMSLKDEKQQKLYKSMKNIEARGQRLTQMAHEMSLRNHLNGTGSKQKKIDKETGKAQFKFKKVRSK
mmetsp:Transcript_23932/g.28952  ORF Transcript_23932/g.28952 Transcript_23932/m.28952 type:complete len:218 (-) Transcript_23932:156-809(-)|eukprot:CAMPEP_0197863420 /NCGR_PEP_ID=MMETSP1438-20131217/40852_1 /TAXON_ID=1461541 /ORGANISM="Pterosperma sp., Strain CCMP1384" /LENGTH=217 /DNA_ID=CAMNT_0043481299 /DNA_START=106 /DNA_END=759 /DNA_ORIENTATION=-